jgi:hypothetical protein
MGIYKNIFEKVALSSNWRRHTGALSFRYRMVEARSLRSGPIVKGIKRDEG